jgi:hypothetical protein
VAAFWCHQSELKYNQHPSCLHHDTVECSGREHIGIMESCAGYRVCFQIRGVVLCKLRDVKIQNAGGVFTGKHKRMEV